MLTKMTFVKDNFDKMFHKMSMDLSREIDNFCHGEDCCGTNQLKVN